MSNQLPPGGVREYLVGLVNAKTGMSIDYAEVDFVDPLLLDGSTLDFTDPFVRNSRVGILNDPPGGPPGGSVQLDYNRLYLPKLFTHFSTYFTSISNSAIQLVDYLPAINARLNTSILPEDIVDLPVHFQGPNLTIELAAAPSSLYIFGTVQLTITNPSGVVVID